jgi:hypothetical protein
LNNELRSIESQKAHLLELDRARQPGTPTSSGILKFDFQPHKRRKPALAQFNR